MGTNPSGLSRKIANPMANPIITVPVRSIPQAPILGPIDPPAVSWNSAQRRLLELDLASE